MQPALGKVGQFELHNLQPIRKRQSEPNIAQISFALNPLLKVGGKYRLEVGIKAFQTLPLNKIFCRFPLKSLRFVPLKRNRHP